MPSYLVDVSKSSGVKFIYASSSCLRYQRGKCRTEDLPLLPSRITQNIKPCEDVLMEKEQLFVTLILRPSTVCGYSLFALDLTVNILTNLAVNNRKLQYLRQQMRLIFISRTW